MTKKLLDGEAAWRGRLEHILKHGGLEQPRGLRTTEELHTGIITIDMARAVVTAPLRKLSYRYQCAEALWILSGSNSLGALTDGLPKMLERMAKFSDDGVTLAGAYGPPIAQQKAYVLNTLCQDQATRQAVLTIWRPNPGPSKDIPCTVAMSFSIRKRQLHLHVYMRSSDAWLGIPYDMFTFACVGIQMACYFNMVKRHEPNFEPVDVGQLTISMTSSHIYDTNVDEVNAVLDAPRGPVIDPVPLELVSDGAWAAIEADLIRQRNGEPAVAWKVRP